MKHHHQESWSSAEKRIAQFEAFLKESRSRSSIRLKKHQRPRGGLTLSNYLDLIGD